MTPQQPTFRLSDLMGSSVKPVASHDPAPSGLLEYGNIDIYNRPTVRTAKGPATVRSKSWNFGGVEVLLPTVADGRELTDAEAVERYRRTGEHLGKFKTAWDATTYATRLHDRYQSGELTRK